MRSWLGIALGVVVLAALAARLPDYDRYLSGYFDFQALLGRDEASLSRCFGEFREF